MPKPRRTVHLHELVEWVNARNASSTCQSAIREGWNSLVSSFLMSADAYAGFGYLKADELKGEAIGNPPGIVWNGQGEGKHLFPDESRIRFYTKGL